MPKTLGSTMEGASCLLTAPLQCNGMDEGYSMNVAESHADVLVTPSAAIPCKFDKSPPVHVKRRHYADEEHVISFGDVTFCPLLPDNLEISRKRTKVLPRFGQLGSAIQTMHGHYIPALEEPTISSLQDSNSQPLLVGSQTNKDDSPQASVQDSQEERIAERKQHDDKESLLVQPSSGGRCTSFEALAA